MDKTTFVFGATPESDQSKFIKFFSRISLSLLLSLFLLILVLGIYLGLLFFSQNINSDISQIQAQTQAIKDTLAKEPLRSNLTSILDIDKRIKTANVLLDSHSSVKGILEMLQIYTLPNVYLKTLSFVSERAKTAPAIQTEFNSLKDKLKELLSLVKNEQQLQILQKKYDEFRNMTGFPKANILNALNDDLKVIDSNFGESENAISKAKELEQILSSLVQKLSIGESLKIEGEAANFSAVAKQVVTYREIERKQFMSPNDKVVQKISVGNLRLTQDGKVAFQIEMTLSPNYLLVR